jgi:cytochrome c-type biogenesis protein CcmE
MPRNAGIDARENIQYFTFAGELAQRDVREIFGDQRKRLRFSASLRNGALNRNGVALEMHGL